MIDWNRVRALREEVGAEDFDEVIGIFLEEVDGEIDGLSGSPPDTLSERLHFLKGSALNLGFSSFSDLCQAGETTISAADDTAVDLPALVACYQQSRARFLSEVADRTGDHKSV